MRERDYSPLLDDHQRLADAQRRQQEEEQREREAKGYRLLDETQERLTGEQRAREEAEQQERTRAELGQEAAGKIDRQWQEMTRPPVGRDQEAGQPAQLDGPEIAPQAHEASRVHSGGDLQLTPFGPMFSHQQQRPTREREAEGGKEQETEQRAETSDARAEVTDARAAKSDRQQALEQFLANRAQQREGLSRERDDDDGREM